MSKINLRYIDKHWLVYVMRGCLAALFGLLMLFNCIIDTGSIATPIGVFLLCMGAIDAVSAIYSSNKRHGWINSIIDSMIDVIAALVLLFIGRDSLIACVVILAVYTLISGIVDLVHGFISTVDPTDRFIHVLIGVAGCVIGVVILNAGAFDVNEFFRFFGTYVILVGVTSLIYGVHNRAQLIEAHELMREMAHDRAETRARLEAAKKPRLLRRWLEQQDKAKATKPKAKVETKLPSKETTSKAKTTKKSSKTSRSRKSSK